MTETHLPPRRKPLAARVGVFGVGLDIYWGQFPGLLDTLLGYLDTFVAQVAAHGVDVTNFGIVDNAQAAYALLPRLQAAELDLVFVDMLTYATSSTFGALIRALDVPVVLVALQPLKRLDYAHATIEMQLKNDNICSLPEFAGVAVRMGRCVPPMIIGTLDDDPRAGAEIATWCRIARVLHDLKRARIGHFHARSLPHEVVLQVHNQQRRFINAVLHNRSSFKRYSLFFAGIAWRTSYRAPRIRRAACCASAPRTWCR